MSRPEKYPRYGDKKVFDANFDAIFRKPRARVRRKPVPRVLRPVCDRGEVTGRRQGDGNRVDPARV